MPFSLLAPLEEDQRRDLNELLVDPKRENAVNFRKTMTQEAREEGISRGIEKGQREVLLRLCQRKFKNFPVETIRNQIETMSVAEIEELEERLLIAQSPEELGLIDQ